MFEQSYPHYLLEGVRARGFEPENLLRMADIPVPFPVEGVPYVDFARLVGVVARTLDDEFLGLLDRRQPFGTFALQVAYARHGEDLLDVYRRLMEFASILDLSLVQTLELNDGALVHRIRRVPGRVVLNRLAIEMSLVLTHRFVSWLGALRLPIEAVELDYGPADHAEGYRFLFPRAPIRFHAESSSIRIPESALRRRVRRTEEEARRWGRRTPLDAFLPTVAGLGVALEVATYIERTLLDTQRCPTMEETAAAVGLKPHTLRRRLTAEGSDYLLVRSHAKRDVAIQLLLSTPLSVEQVGFRVGFSAANAFVRAFRGWTGVTPRAYREGGLRAAS